MPDEKRPRPVIAYMTTMWGAAWAFSLGSLVLAPRVLAVHHLRPEGARQWATTDIVLGLVFVALGTILSFLASAPLVVWRTVRGRPWQRPSWLAALASVPLLTTSYLGAGFGVACVAFSGGVAASLFQPVLARASIIVVATLIPLFYAYPRLACQRTAKSAARLAVVLLVAGLAGFALLPYRVAASGSASPGTAAGHSDDGLAAPPPLLFVGLDSGNWATLRPLIARHKLPTFERLLRAGVSGPMKAEWEPFWSRPAWAAILTGFGRDQTGIHEDLAAHAPGLPTFEIPLELDAPLAPLFAIEYIFGRAGLIRVTPPSRTMLRQRPVWELLEGRGIRTAVIRFDFTYPAEGASVMISNRVGHDEWDLMKMLAAHPSRALVAPADEAASLLASFDHPAPADPREWAALRPSGPPSVPRDAVVDPEQVLRIAYDVDRESFDAADRIVRSHRDVSAVALYLPGFDGVCHAFWPYRFPEQYPDAPPDGADVRRLGAVVDRYLQFLDARLAGLLAAFGRPPNVVMVSDHGHTAIASHPIWRGWHGPEGIFIAAGPSFTHRDAPVRASYFDVAPTLLSVEGLGGDLLMPGHALAGVDPEKLAAAREGDGRGSQDAKGRPD